jgi:hypothetical protein
MDGFAERVERAREILGLPAPGKKAPAPEDGAAQVAEQEINDADQE